MHVAYLAGTYPAVSHTFIAREIEALRSLGVDIETFSLHPPEAGHLLTNEDRRAAATTRTFQPPPWPAVIAAHAGAMAAHPLRYLRTLMLSQRLSPPGGHMRLWHLFYFAEAILLWSWLRRAGISHVHVHFANAASMVALLYADFGETEGASFSFTMHGPTEFDDVKRFRLGEKVARAKFVACISDYARSQMMRFSAPEDWNRLEVVRCGVDTDLWAAAGKTSEKNGLRLLTVARLTADKGVALLLRAIAEVAREGITISAEIVGDGPDRDALTELADQLGIDDRISFLGFVGQDTIRAHYESADVFCLPSFAEGIPVVLMEAMALSKPVIAPRLMGIPELVEDRKTGVLIAPGRVDALRAAIMALNAMGPEKREAMGRAGREEIIGNYEIDRSAGRLRELFGEATTLRH
jgi:glycosyltransferase involved in cell wall biosynthesis